MLQVAETENEIDPRGVVMGNIWQMAAHMALEMAQLREGPWAVSVRPSGTLDAVTAEHPEFVERLMRPDYICMVSGATDIDRLASRIREAVERCAQA